MCYKSFKNIPVNDTCSRIKLTIIVTFITVLIPHIQIEVLNEANAITYQPASFVIGGESVTGIGLQAGKVRKPSKLWVAYTRASNLLNAKSVFP